MSDSIELIKTLRERTGAGLMDCKRALQANDNDIEKSITWLREKGITKQAAKAARIAADGLASVAVGGDTAAVVEINCETDFVARSDAFIKLVKEVNQIALKAEPKDLEALKAAKGEDGRTVETMFTDAGIKIGEKLSLRRFCLIHKKPEQLFGTYVHMNGTMIGVVVVDGKDQEFANEIAMCVVSDNPSYVSIKDVPADELAKEKEVQAEAAKTDPNFAKKPAQIQEKIIEGRVQKHFEDQVFGFEEFVSDSTKTVDQALKEHATVVASFVRYQVGEGMEKRHDDFAAEVAAQAAGK
jgi:elongation factor Ts